MDALTEKRQLGLQVIKRIEELPRPEKWQVTREFLLATNKNASYLDHKFIQQLKEERNNLRNDLTASSKNGDSRFLLSMPDFIYAALIATDPHLQDELNDKDRHQSTKAWKKLANAFPMYKMPRGSL